MAAVSHGRQLSYGALRQRTERIAARLLERDIRPDSVVAILMEPSIDLIPPMLAAWHVGAAFCVLDVRWPDERLAQALRLLEPSAIIVAENEGRIRGHAS